MRIIIHMETNSKSLADRMRAALKSAGYNGRKVSVRHDHYSMGSTVHVTIRDHQISRRTIEAICEPFSSVRRDEQGEILSGGNTFVDVAYGKGVLEVVARPIAEQLAAAGLGVVIEINGARYVKLADGAYGGSVIQGVDSDGCADTRRMNAHCGDPTKADQLMFAARQIAEVAVAAADLAERADEVKIERCSVCNEPTHPSDSDDFDRCRSCIAKAEATEDADVIQFLTAVGAV